MSDFRGNEHPRATGYDGLHLAVADCLTESIRMVTGVGDQGFAARLLQVACCDPLESRLRRSIQRARMASAPGRRRFHIADFAAASAKWVIELDGSVPRVPARLVAAARISSSCGFRSAN
jgi:hypothetical protein